jgi:hypothetical protein
MKRQIPSGEGCHAPGNLIATCASLIPKHRRHVAISGGHHERLGLPTSNGCNQLLQKFHVVPVRAHDMKQRQQADLIAPHLFTDGKMDRKNYTGAAGRCCIGPKGRSRGRVGTACSRSVRTAGPCRTFRQRHDLFICSEIGAGGLYSRPRCAEERARGQAPPGTNSSRLYTGK